MSKPIQLTPKGLAKIQEELRYLKDERRQELSDYMGAALADGDLRENAAYDEARLLQSANETRIADLEEIVARALGAFDTRIIWRHVVPNVLGSVIVLASLQVGGIIILESALSFLGLGVRPPTPTWGGILADGRAFILRFPHIAIFPGLMIVITVLAFNFIGDGLRDALDPHQKTARMGRK